MMSKVSQRLPGTLMARRGSGLKVSIHNQLLYSNWKLQQPISW